MSLLDRVAKRLGYVKPRRRAYEGANTGRLASSWTTMAKPADADIRRGLRALRARAREQAQNNDYVRRFLGQVVSNVVGPRGVQLQARIKDPDGTIDELANQAVENAWADWGRHGVPEVSGRYSWRDVEALVTRTIACDGEVLVRLLPGWRGNAYRCAVQLLDPELLDVDLNRKLGNGRRIVMGVEIDAWRRPIAYHLVQSDAIDDYYSYGGKKYVRVPAQQIIHLFLPELVWQTRGVPWMASALIRLNMLHGYEEAELIAARIAASKMGFYQMADDAQDMEPPKAEDGQKEEGEFVTDAEPGTFSVLPYGYKFADWNPDHPTTAYGEFVKSCLRGISSGLNISYNTLANDLEGVNYSSIRAGVLEDRETWKALQRWLIQAFHERVYRLWLSTSLLNGAITVNGNPLKAERQPKYEQVSWQGRRWAWVDPLKDIQAAEKAIALGIRSRSDVIRESGQDPEEVWQEIARERERLKELEIPITNATPGATSGVFTPTPQGESDAADSNN